MHRRLLLLLLVATIHLFTMGQVRSVSSQTNSHQSVPHSFQTEKEHPVAGEKWSSGMCAVIQNNKWGFINADHLLIIPYEYDLVYGFSGPTTAVSKDKKWFLIDKLGRKIANTEYQYIGPFVNGMARVINNGQSNIINFQGNTVQSNWTSISPSNFTARNQNNFSANVGCPNNIDFENGNLNLWTCDTGQVVGPTNSVNGVSSSGLNEVINTAVTPPLADRHVLMANSGSNPPDPYGGFSVNPPDGSGYFIKLGSDLSDPNWFGTGPGSKTESVSYIVNVPSNTTDLNFIYDFAVVLNEPIPGTYVDPNTGTQVTVPVHLLDDKPRFKVEIFDLTTNTYTNCGKIEYVADPNSAGAGGFQVSPASNVANTIWFKPWTRRFVNLVPYKGHNIRIKFTTVDCTLGAHWGYAYLDIEGCKAPATAVRTCSTPRRTVMDGPSFFQTYEWYSSNYATHYGSGVHLVSNANISAGDTIRLICTPAPVPFIGQSCPDTINVVVSQPSINFDAGPDLSFCEGQSGTIGNNSIGNATYSWYPSSGLSSTTSSLVTAAPSVTTMYHVNVTDNATGCSTTDSVKVVVKASPHVNITTTSACHNQTSTITVTGGDQFIWTPDPRLNIDPAHPNIATTAPPDTPARDTFHINVGLNATGCNVDTSIYVSAYPLPIVDFFVPAPQCLRGNQFALTSGSIIYPGVISSNQWVVNNTTVIQGSDVFVSFPSVGVYPVKLISRTDHGCIDSVTRYLEVLAEPHAVFSPPASSCLSGNLLTFQSNSTATGASIDSVFWDFGDNSSATSSLDTAFTHHFLTAGNFNVHLTIFSNNGCKDDTTGVVRIFPMPVADFAQPDSQCLRGNHFVFNSQSTATPPSTITSNVWSIGSLVSTGQNFSYSFVNPGTYRVKLVSTSNEGCKDSITQVLMVYPEPVASFQTPATLCFLNNNFLFSSNSSVATGSIDSCFWNFGDGTSAVGNPLRHPYTNPSVLQYQIQLIVKTNYGCKDTTQRSIQFLASPAVSINPVTSLSLCSGDSITLHATAQTSAGSITSYQWSVGNTNIPGATGTSITVQTSGVYQIHVTNTNNCSATSGDDTVVVHPAPLGNVVLPNENFICENGQRLLTCNSNAASYQWYLDGTPITGATSSTYMATLPGIYSVQLVSGYGCKNFANGSIAMSLRKKPIVSFTFPSYCVEMPIHFINTSTINESGPINWLWDFGDSIRSNAFEPTHIYNSSGTDTITLTATSVDCPSLSDATQVTIPVASPITGIRYPAMNAEKNRDLQLSCRDLGNGILWLPSRGLSNPNISHPVFNNDTEVEYLIRLGNQSGCLTYDTLLVRVFEHPDIYVPTAFSPNGDGHNDLLDVFTVGISKFIRFMVYNRWGQLLYETTDPAQKWDGTFKGKKQPAETYVWLAEGKDQIGISIFRRGQTILIR